jgi:hypothetical protein
MKLPLELILAMFIGLIVMIFVQLQHTDIFSSLIKKKAKRGPNNNENLSIVNSSLASSYLSFSISSHVLLTHQSTGKKQSL